MYSVTRYINFELVTYTVDNWNHVACLLAVEKCVSWSRIAV